MCRCRQRLFTRSHRQWTDDEPTPGRPGLCCAAAGRPYGRSSRPARAVTFFQDTARDIGWVVQWDLATGQETGRRGFPSAIAADIVHSQRYILLWKNEEIGSLATIRQFLGSLPVVGRIIPKSALALSIFDTVKDQELTTFRPGDPDYGFVSPDGSTFVTRQSGSEIQFWDIPPRKPLTWLAIAAGVWALPVAWLARRRTRRMASGVA